MDKGSLKSFHSENADGQNNNDNIFKTLNMDKLIMNPGRPSLGSGDNSNNRERGSVGAWGKAGNIFAARVRNNKGGSDEKTRN